MPNFPTSLDSLTNPVASDKLNSATVPHATQHSTVNDILEVLEAKVGVNSSAVTTSLDYKINQLNRAATFVVAASDAPAKIKAAADYVCDGTADQVEINAALAALNADWGMVLLTEGTFNVAASVTIQKHSTMLMGHGTGNRSSAAQGGRGTFIKAATGLTTAVILVQNATNDHPVYGVTIRDLNVDGNSVGIGVDGIVFKSNQGLLDHVHVHLCTGDGIQLEGYNGDELYDTVVRHCISSHNSGAGLFLNTYAADSRVLDCTLYTNSGDGLKVKAGGCQAVGGQYYNNSGNGLRFDGGGSFFMLSDVKIENSGEEGIYFNAATTGMEYINIDGCTFRYNGKDQDATYPHIGGAGNQQCSNVNISGCRFSGKPDLSPDNKATYGIDIWNANGPKYWLVSACVFAQPTANHFRTGAIRNAGLNCKVRNCQGVADSGLTGSATIPSGSTSVTVTHNLPYTPTAADFTITPTNNPTNDPGDFWIDTFTSTQFNINVRSNPGASGAIFQWKAS